MGGNPRKNPPEFSVKRSYERYRKELNAWVKVADYEKAQLASVIALNLPTSDAEGDVRGKVFEDLGDDLEGEGGVQKLLDWLDKHYRKDEITRVVEKIRKLMGTKRNKDQEVGVYLSSFDVAYNSLNTSGDTRLPQSFLMFLLMENAGLTETEWQMIMAGVDTLAAGTLYDQARRQITKIIGGHKHKVGDKFELVEDTHYTHGSSDAYYAGKKFNQRPQAGQGGNWRPDFPSYQPRFPFTPKPPGGGGAFRPRGPNVKIDVPTNPIGKDGKRSLCHICGSFSHFKARCPHNPVNYVDNGYEENSFEVNYIPREEMESQAAGTNADIVHQMVEAGKVPEDKASFYATLDSFVVLDVLADLQQVSRYDMKDERGKVVLDTGCISNVCGTDWFRGHVNGLSDFAKRRIIRTKSTKVFKFGGGTKLPSIGTFTIPCNVGGKDVALTVDVVEQPDLPCLLSQESMRRAGAILNFNNNTINLFGREVAMTTNAGGHPVIQLEAYKGDQEEETKEVLWQVLDSKDRGENFKRLMKMHEGLGHPGRDSFERMLKSQDSFNQDVKDLVNTIYEQCVTCLTYKKSIPRPHVAVPIARDFNDTLAVDLKIWPKKNAIILYAIDAFSRFTMAKEIPDKKADTILKPILEDWILKGFGPPKQIIFDNGREFSNKSMREMCEVFNIQMLTSGGFSPFQNGLCEKNHHIVDMMVEKMMHGNPDMTFSRALASAVYAKNCMINNQGYSPLQLVMGKQPRMPGPAQDNAPPANRETTSHKLTHERITDIFSARQAFSEIENSNRLKKALNTRVPNLDRYQPGERVFYKFGKDPWWHGPGNVVAQDNKVIFIRHGGSIISTSPSRVQKIVQPEQEDIRVLNPQKKLPQNGRDVTPGDSSDDDSSSSDSSSDSDSEPEDEGQEEEQNNNQPEPPELVTSDDEEGEEDQAEAQTPFQTPQSEASPATGDMGAELSSPRGPPNTPRPRVARRNLEASGDLDVTRDLEEERGEREKGTEREKEKEGGGEKEKERENGEENEEVHEEVQVKQTKQRYPAKGNWIIFKNKDEQYYFRAHVIERVTKRSVKKNIWFNIRLENGVPDCINIDEKDWAIIEKPEGMHSPEIISPAEKRKKRKRVKKSTTFSPSPNPAARKVFKPSPSVHALICYRVDQIEQAQAEEAKRVLVTLIDKKHWNEPAVIEAKQKEIQNFIDHQAFEWVPDIGQPRLSSGWVITVKMFNGIEGAKARAVAHGNQEWQEHPSDAPTATKIGLRLLFAICAQKGWRVMTCDVTSAFLQADLTREVFVQPPKDMQRPGYLWRLKRAMYGLDDASLLWYKTVEKEMYRLGCKKLQSDPAIFYYHHPEQKTLEGILGWHVDDANGGGSQIFYDNVMKPLMDRFKFGSMATDNFSCLGWNVEHEDGAIYISQKDYIDAKVEVCDIDKGEMTSKDFLDEEQTSKLRSVIGKLRWTTDQTRPDVAFENLVLSMNSHKPTFGDVTLANKVATRLKNQVVRLKYGKLEGDKWHLTVFADASRGNLGNKIESTVAYIIFLSDGYKKNQKNKCCVLAWSAKKAKRVCTSTLDAEAMALNNGCQAAIVMKKHILEILNWEEDLISIEAYTDCMDVYKSIVEKNKADTAATMKGDKLSALDIAAVKGYMQEKMIDDLQFVYSDMQLADTLTKLGKAPDALIKAVTEGEF